MSCCTCSIDSILPNFRQLKQIQFVFKTIVLYLVDVSLSSLYYIKAENKKDIKQTKLNSRLLIDLWLKLNYSYYDGSEN